MNAEINFTGDIQRITPKEGDVFLLTIEKPIDDMTCKNLLNHLKEKFNLNCIIITGGGKVSITAVNPEDVV